MQTLAQSLQDHDRGHLKIIAYLWGFELPNQAHPQVVEELARAMLEGTPLILDSLPGEAHKALEHLLENGGKAPLETLVRQYGPIRDMGPGKRDRLMPWKEPESPLEMLWYRGILAKAFTDADSGPQEYGFVPDDLLARMPETVKPDRSPMGESVAAPKAVVRSGTAIVDDAATVLAAYRRAASVDRKWLLKFLQQPESLEMVEELLYEAEIMEDPERIRDFLELPVGEAAALLYNAWVSSTAWNELSQVPGLASPTGKWPNEPLANRRAALGFFQNIPGNTWWSLSSFVEAVHAAQPEFMRPPGGFDSWYLQSDADGSNLSGFGAWHEVEGRYLKFLIVRSMFWLGRVELAQDQSAFRIVEPAMSSTGDDSAVAYPDGRIRIGRAANRALRYQIARLCSWEKNEKEAYTYRLSASSLTATKAQGLTASHAGQVLKEVDAPESLLAAVARWHTKGEEVRVERQTLLRVREAKTLTMLTEHPTTRRYIKERLGSSAVLIEERNLHKLLDAALRLGLIISVPGDGEQAQDRP